MNKKRYYIAYGSNLNVPQMHYRCPTARIIGTAEIENYRLLFKGSKTGSYLTIEQSKGDKVPVAVWEVQPDDERRLDTYEGYPTFYYKKDMHLKVKGIKTGKIYERNAFVYIMHEDRLIGIPSRYYINTCLEGYATFKFDPKYLLEAYRFSIKEAISNERK